MSLPFLHPFGSSIPVYILADMFYYTLILCKRVAYKSNMLFNSLYSIVTERRIVLSHVRKNMT